MLHLLLSFFLSFPPFFLFPENVTHSFFRYFRYLKTFKQIFERMYWKNITHCNCKLQSHCFMYATVICNIFCKTSAMLNCGSFPLYPGNFLLIFSPKNSDISMTKVPCYQGKIPSCLPINLFLLHRDRKTWRGNHCRLDEFVTK